MELNKELEKWHPYLHELVNTPAGRSLGEVLARDNDILCPSIDNVFRAFRLTGPEDVRVVILGQDPYPSAHADGLAFSSGIDDVPYSLKQIITSMKLNGISRSKISLEDWAEQGVLLLNTALSTVKRAPGTHLKYWTPWIHRVLQVLFNLSESGKRIAFICWGSFAQNMIARFPFGSNVLVVKGYHPSSVRYGYIFKGGEHFIQVNRWFATHNEKIIQWGDN